MKNKGFPDFHNLRLFYLWYVGLSCFLFYFKEIKLTMKSTNKGRRRIRDCQSDVVAHGGEWDGGERMIIDDGV